MKFLLSIIIVILTIVATSSAQGNYDWRIIARANSTYYSGAFAIADSIHYYTSGNNLCDAKRGYFNDSSLQYIISNNQPNITQRIVNTLDAVPHITGILTQAWTGNTHWENSSQYVQTYTNNELTGSLYKAWNTANNSWLNQFQTLDTFVNNLRTVRINQNWDSASAAWINQYKTATSYTGNNIASSLSYSWNVTTNTWQLTNQLVYTYDGNNRVTQFVGQAWDAVNNIWKNSSKITYSYSAANDTMLYLNQSWNNTSNTWVNGARVTTVYDANHNQASQTGEGWDVNTSTWHFTSRTLSTYNSSGMVETITNEAWIAGNGWQHVNNNFMYRYYYEQFLNSTGIKSTGDVFQDLLVYPIPARGELNVDWKKENTSGISILLTDMQGKVIFHGDAITDHLHYSIPTSQLTNGTYLLQVVCDGKMTGKMLEVTH